MPRRLSIAFFMLFAVSMAVAQTPKGWKVRIDRSTNASDPDAAGAVKLLEKDGGLRAVTPQAAVFWTPENKAEGSYTVKGAFTLIKPSHHLEYYGLIFGGKDLEGADQKYLYFMVAEDGSWLVKSRDGASTQNVSAKTPSDAVKKPDATGKSTNELEVRVKPDKVEYAVNGTTVYTTPKTGLTANTDGIYGIRVNHMLEVQVDGFGGSKQ